MAQVNLKNIEFMPTKINMEFIMGKKVTNLAIDKIVIPTNCDRKPNGKYFST